MPRFHVDRSITIDREPSQVYEAIADYGTWTTWSPWLCAEPTAKVTVSDDPNSIGSLYSWDGEVVGAGEIEHRSLIPNELIDDEIRFLKPFKSTSSAGFKLGEDHGKTVVTWYMDGNLPWFLFWMRSMTESFVGMDFNRGLHMLKEWLETGKVLSRTDVKGVQSIGPIQMVGVRKTAAMYDIGSSMKQAFDECQRLMESAGLSTDDQSISVYHKMDMKTVSFDYTSGWIVPEIPSQLPPGLGKWEMPNVQALRVDHYGTYENLGNAWSTANQYARYKKMKQSKVGTFELYKTMPGQVDDAEVLTEIYLPLR